ncbi:MAG: hypothetical protein KAG97_07085, partial [Victivallales bacterium]|nr:hypothetical protein [Victivallales bacterium]
SDFCNWLDFLEILCPIICNFVATAAAVIIFVIVQIHIGLKEILYCVAIPAVFVGFMSTLFSLFSEKVNPYYAGASIRGNNDKNLDSAEKWFDNRRVDATF